MISLYDNKIQLPNSWLELTTEQFCSLAGRVNEYLKAGYGIETFRLHVLDCISGYKRSSKRYTPDEQEQINNNLYIISEKITFVIKPKYENEEIIEVLSPKLRECLKTQFPFSIYDPDLRFELESVINLLNYKVVVNLDIPQNLLPHIESNKKTFIGPTFNISPLGVLETDLKTGEYLDALDYYNIFEQTHEKSALEKLAGVLYRTDRSKYSTFEAQKNASNFTKINPDILFGAWLMFSAWQHYFKIHPVIGLLFIDRETNSNKVSLGSSEQIYSMSKDGYGDTSKLLDMPVTDFFLIQIKYLKDIVQTLRAHKKTDVQIASEMDIPFETVTKL